MLPSNKYNFKNNIIGGFTAAVIALPLGLAFGVASGMGASAGINGAIILGFIAALFSGTPTQISGPTGPMTVIIASTIITLHNDIRLIATTIILAGIFQIVFGISRIGQFVKYIPYPVVSGFMSGIGVIIIVLQINPFFGVPSEASVIQIFSSLAKNIANINWDSAGISIATLLIMFFTPRKIAQIIPSPLIALFCLTPLSIYLGLDVQTIGEIPQKLPDIITPAISLESYQQIIVLGFTLAVLGSIDTLLTSVVADSITHTKHKPNKELIAQGLGNSVCGLFGAVPGAGATMRTVINIKSGGTNKISGITHSVVIFLVVVFFTPIAEKIPMALLAGILIKVGIDIIDYRFIRVWKSSPGHDLAVMLVVFFVTVFIDLITAVGVGIILSSLLIVYRITRETQITLVNEPLNSLSDDLGSSTRILSINGVFFFGSSIAFERNVNETLDIKRFVIDISNIPFMDLTAIFTLKDIILRLKESNIDIIIVAKKREKIQLLKFNKTGVFDDIRFLENIQQL
jgi:SulP family sulfate permease